MCSTCGKLGGGEALHHQTTYGDIMIRDRKRSGPRSVINISGGTERMQTDGLGNICDLIPIKGEERKATASTEPRLSSLRVKRTLAQTFGKLTICKLVADGAKGERPHRVVWDNHTKAEILKPELMGLIRFRISDLSAWNR